MCGTGSQRTHLRVIPAPEIKFTHKKTPHYEEFPLLKLYDYYFEICILDDKIFLPLFNEYIYTPLLYALASIFT